ncbi:MAG: hypothetical protein CO135_01255 [Candidatus Levybacteria bacterium CG_4_9_14_3_um_filter_35_16]|nr:MAG: hypothetical protein COY68_03940 [Candidatus Levybacteria bacterium CG_4_10_14_0_8_um_filter_35_23]PJA91408.1 MAG: hypothetical protein CO135_01255 [Candidatus Levybacteria bacterium CG_4_9_14_3_um_filter_35_16]PJC54199.1 MAG: hypothetical protein CO028_03620 [Candidatus Levybacteria bacterium CG_4_9_14_0_2_um_filter_35_21]
MKERFSLKTAHEETPIACDTQITGPNIAAYEEFLRKICRIPIDGTNGVKQLSGELQEKYRTGTDEEKLRISGIVDHAKSIIDDSSYIANIESVKQRISLESTSNSNPNNRFFLD